MREDAESTGLADNGDLEQDLQALLEAVGAAAQKASTALIIFIDEMQYVAKEELAALIMVLLRCARRKLPFALVGAGLPQLRGLMGDAKFYAERLFDFPEMGPLLPSAARIAITKPARDLRVAFDARAVEQIVEETKGCIPISCKSGASIPGMRRPPLPSNPRTYAPHRKLQSRLWTRVFFGCASIDLLQQKRSICARWLSWGQVRIAQAILRRV